MLSKDHMPNKIRQKSSKMISKSKTKNMKYHKSGLPEIQLNSNSIYRESIQE